MQYNKLISVDWTGDDAFRDIHSNAFRLICYIQNAHHITIMNHFTVLVCRIKFPPKIMNSNSFFLWMGISVSGEARICILLCAMYKSPLMFARFLRIKLDLTCVEAEEGKICPLNFQRLWNVGDSTDCLQHMIGDWIRREFVDERRRNSRHTCSTCMHYSSVIVDLYFSIPFIHFGVTHFGPHANRCYKFEFENRMFIFVRSTSELMFDSFMLNWCPPPLCALSWLKSFYTIFSRRRCLVAPTRSASRDWMEEEK